ncbi:hypothetical protein [Glycomyces sp. NPDC021274]|uniref:hypothetical protein n=1 Tax=Glycomyces sp. NPDC021274 TaxID=3155120 RepID=UPI0033E02B9C
MNPPTSDWLPVAATLVAALIQGLAALGAAFIMVKRSTSRDAELPNPVGSVSPRSHVASRWALIGAGISTIIGVWIVILNPTYLAFAVVTCSAMTVNGAIYWIAWRRDRKERSSSTAERIDSQRGVPLREKLPEGLWKWLDEQAAVIGNQMYDWDGLPDLKRVYTEQELQVGADRDKTASMEKDTELESGPFTTDVVYSKARPIQEILLDKEIHHIMVTGEAGVGKSSLLHRLEGMARKTWLDHDVSTTKESDPDVVRLVPVRIAASRLVGSDGVLEAFGVDGERWLARAPAEGVKWLVMVDAIDEVTDPEHRKHVEAILLEAIDEAEKAGGHVRYLITSRGINDELWRSLAFRDVTEFKLEPFSRAQLRTFLNRQQSGKVKATRDNDGKSSHVSSRVDQFISRIEMTPGLLSLVCLPLLARVSSDLYFAEEGMTPLPARRVDIYSDAVAHWINQFSKRIQSAHDVGADGAVFSGRINDYIVGNVPGAKILNLLEEVAAKYLEADRTNLLDVLCEHLDIPTRPKSGPEYRGARILLEATGLAKDVWTGDPKWIHHSFAEFLHSRSRAESLGLEAAAWDERIRDANRRVGTIFAFSRLNMADRTTLLEELISGSGTSVTAAWIVAEGLHDGMRDRVIEALFANLPGKSLATEWWDVLELLAAVPLTRKYLAAFAADSESHAYRRVNAAILIANHDAEQGREVLGFLAGNRSGLEGLERIDAITALGDLDRSQASALLRDMASRPNSDESRRAACRSLLELDQELGLKASTALALDSRTSMYHRNDIIREVGLCSPLQAVEIAEKLIRNSMIHSTYRANCLYAIEDDEFFRRAAASVFDEHSMHDGDKVKIAAAVLRKSPGDSQASSILRIVSTGIHSEELAKIDAVWSLGEYDPIACDATMQDFVHGREFSRMARVYAAKLYAGVATRRYNWRTIDIHRLEPLRQLLKSAEADDYVRLEVARVLLGLKDEEGLRLWRALESDRGTGLLARVRMLGLLGEAFSSFSKPELMGLIENDEYDDMVRTVAAHTLAEWGEAEGVDSLELFASNPKLTDSARSTAIFGLRLCSVDRVIKLAEDVSLPHIFRLPFFSVLGIDYEFCQQLLMSTALDEEVSLTLRKAAARLTVERFRFEYIEDISELQSNVDLVVVAELIEALSCQVNSSNAASIIQAHLLSSILVRKLPGRTPRDVLGNLALRKDVQFLTSAIIGQFDTEASVERLIEMSKECSEPNSRHGVLARLGVIESHQWLFKQATSGGDIGERIAAAEQLGAVDAATGVSILSSIVSSTSVAASARMRAASALAEIDRPEGISLLDGLFDEAGWSCCEQLELHGRRALLGWTASFASLSETLRSSTSPQHCRVTAADWLTMTGDPSALEFLQGLAGDCDQEARVRSMAEEALARHFPDRVSS